MFLLDEVSNSRTSVEKRSRNPHRDHVIPRPSTKMNSKLATAAAAIHAGLRRMGPTCSVSLRLILRIMLGRLSRPAFAPKVEGNADAIT